MNFPILPTLSFIHFGSADAGLNVGFTVLLALLTVWEGFSIFVRTARENKYTRSSAVRGFIWLLAAAALAIFGIYNVVFAGLVVICLGVLVALGWFVVWKLIIRIVIWRFLIKFVFWRVIALNFWIAVTGKKIQSEPKDEEAKAKTTRGGHGEGSY